MLLDENVSPAIVRPLSDAGHDVYHVRDRGLTGQPDHVIWRRAIDESRVLVTINALDFVRLGEREELHGGLITFSLRLDAGRAASVHPARDRAIRRRPRAGSGFDESMARHP